MKAEQNKLQTPSSTRNIANLLASHVLVRAGTSDVGAYNRVLQ